MIPYLILYFILYFYYKIVKNNCLFYDNWDFLMKTKKILSNFAIQFDALIRIVIKISKKNFLIITGKIFII